MAAVEQAARQTTDTTDCVTVATAGLLLAHATVAAATTSPFWSRTSAANCTVAPNAVSSALAGIAGQIRRAGFGPS